MQLRCRDALQIIKLKRKEVGVIDIYFFFIDKFFLKISKITIDFIHLMMYNYKYKGGEKVGKKQNKKEDSKQETLLKLSIILALVQLIKTIIELIAKIF
jgi:hypothetical protein